MLKKMMSIGLCLGLCLWLTVPPAAGMTYEEQEALQDYFKKNDQIREFGAKPLDLLNNPKYKQFFEQYGNALLVIRIANEYNLNNNWEAAKLIFEKLAEKGIEKLSREFADVFGWFSFVKTGLELFKTFYVDPALVQYELDFYASGRRSGNSPHDSITHLKNYGHVLKMAEERYKKEYGPQIFEEEDSSFYKKEKLLPRWQKRMELDLTAWFEAQYQLRLARQAVAEAKIVKSNKDRELLALLQKSDGMGTNYLGCFKDQGDPTGTRGRDLSGFVLNDPAMTVDKCVSLCRQKGFPYAGAQYSSWCFCGNDYGKSGKVENCNMKCAGNPEQICGGAWANSIYGTR